MHRPRARFYLPLLATVLVTAVADARIAKTGDAHVSFTASGPGGLSIIGTTSDLAVAETGEDIVVTVPLQNLDTKIALRNKHMRERYLDVPKYPNAELRVAKSAVVAAAGKATGTFTLHGRSRPMTFSYATKPDGASRAVSGSLRVDMLEFGIEKPSYAGLSVKPEVDVNVAFHVNED